jgi:hypothetical protein
MMKIHQLLALPAAAMLASCTTIYFDFTVYTNGGTTTTSSTSSSTTSSTTATTLCTPGATQSCYDGPAGTEGVGLCKAGEQTCAADGASWGACVGEVLPMPEDCATPEDEDCDGKAPPCKGALLWAKVFGDADEQHATAIAADPQGNVLLGGNFSGTIDFGGGPLSGPGSFVTKLDPTGQYLWSEKYAGEALTGLAVDSSGNVLVGGGIAIAFVTKLDTTGAQIWSRQFGSSGNGVGANSVAVDAAGNVLLTGYFLGTVDFGGGPVTSYGTQDAFVLKLDSTGAYTWVRHYGAPDDLAPLGAGIAASPTGDVLVTGTFSGSIDTGSGVISSAGGNDVFVALLDGASGSTTWFKRYGDASTQSSQGIAATLGGGALVTGGFKSTIDFGGGPVSAIGAWDTFLADLGSNGSQAWSMHFGAGNPTDTTNGSGVAVDVSGNVVVTGSFAGAVNFGDAPLASMGGHDVFLAKLDTGGAHQWSKRFGSTSTQTSAAVTTDVNGRVLLTGYFSKAIDFGKGPMPSAGGSDVFVAAFSP